MNLKELLKQKKITQDRLIDYFLKHNHYKYQQQISNWLNGKRQPDLMSIYLISKCLRCSVEEVFDAVLETLGLGAV